MSESNNGGTSITESSNTHELIKIPQSPIRSAINVQNIPYELKALERWVNWEYNDSMRKIPKQLNGFSAFLRMCAKEYKIKGNAPLPSESFPIDLVKPNEYSEQ